MDNVDWNMVGALAQIAAAAATFAAVIVSLWLGVWQRRPRLKLRVTAAAIIGEGWDDDFVSFDVVNRGERAVKIIGYGWRTGWLKHRHMMINHSQWHAYQPPLPYLLAPGDKVTFMNPVDAFLEETERLSDAFILHLPWGRFDRRVMGHVYTADGYSVRSRINPGARKLLLERNPAVLMGARMQKARQAAG